MVWARGHAECRTFRGGPMRFDASLIHLVPGWERFFLFGGGRRRVSAGQAQTEESLLFEAARDLPYRLAQAVFVLDQGQAQVALAGLAEAAAGADGHLGFLQ